MLGIGCKVSETSKKSFQDPLREYIEKEYNGSTAKELSTAESDALDQFFQLKSDVDSVRAPSIASRHTLLQYYAQLEALAAQVPCGTSDAKIRLQFTWYDSFCPRKKITQLGIAFEKAAVMFNVGALESQLGVQTDRNSPEGLKEACQHFMRAAGSFSMVLEDILRECVGEKTPDMTPEGLGMLKYLMLGQAQACFYEKAIKDGMKDGIKAKLVNQALDYYNDALGFCKSQALNSTIDKSWKTHLTYQVKCLRAATQYWQAKAIKEVALARGEGYGEEICRLQVAHVETQEALHLAMTNKLPQSLVKSAGDLQHVIGDHLQRAQKDNASVYLAKVPRFSEVPAVGKASMVRPIIVTPEELKQELSVNLFASFVPNAVIARAASVKEEIRALLQETRDRVIQSNNESKQRLNDMQLPASIEAFQKTSDNGIPYSIWEKVQRVQEHSRANSTTSSGIHSSNATIAVSAQLQSNQRAGEEAEKKLRAIEARLRSEEMDDKLCRENYGPEKWTRARSVILNEPFQSDIDRYFRLLQDARQSDTIVRDKLQINDPTLALLSMSKPRLDSQLPPLVVENSSCGTEIATISKLLLRLSHIVDEKEQLVRDFEVSLDKFNVLPTILSGDETALSKEKQFFETHFVEKISIILVEEQTLLTELTTVNHDFEIKKADDTVMQARQNFLQKICEAVNICEQLQWNAQEGSTFYHDLAARINQLEQTVADHCAARDLEKREMELNVAADHDMRQREMQDAIYAQELHEKMRINTDHNISSDEAYARQLAGNNPQIFAPQSGSVYDYSRIQQPHPPSGYPAGNTGGSISQPSQYSQYPGAFTAPPSATSNNGSASYSQTPGPNPHMYPNQPTGQWGVNNSYPQKP